MKLLPKHLILFVLMLSQIIVANSNRKSPFHFKNFDATIVDKAINKATISFNANAIIGGDISIEISIPQNVKILQKIASLFEEKHIGVLNNFQDFEYSFDLILPQNGYYYIGIEVTNHSIEFLKEPNNYTTRVVYPFYVEMKDGNIVSKNFTVPNTKYILAPTKIEKFENEEKATATFISDIDTSTNNNQDKAFSKNISSITSTYQIQIYIAGRVVYTNFGEKGIPDVSVRLDWDYDNNSTTAYTPYNGGNQLHVEYDKTDMDGNFYFSFIFNSSHPANYYSDKIRLYVNCANSATFDGDLGNGAYFIDYEDLDISNITDNIYFPSIDFEQNDVNRASALRYHYRARLFSINELGFTPNTIRYYMRLNGSTSFFCQPGNCGGMNMSVARIVYNQVPEDYGTAYHEYGHFIEWNKVGFIASHTWTAPHWFQRETEHVLAWNEGWAEFYCAATYNYWYREEMPSSQLSNDDGNVYIWMDFSPSVLSPTTDHHKVEGAVACFFYNLWDGVNLRSPNYTGDNDDITYSGYFIINLLHQRYNILGQLIGSTHIEAYKNALLNYLDSQNDASVNALYNWLIIQSGTAKSATPTNVTVTGNNISRNISWNDNTCPDIYTWPSSSVNLVENNEQGFRIYRKATSASWNGTLNGYSLVATVTQNITNWTDNANLNGHYSYVVVAYNSSGNSLPKAEYNVYYETPSPPENLGISGGTTHGVVYWPVLNWEHPSNGNNLTGYKIYRSITNNINDPRSYSLLAIVSSSTTSYEDNSIVFGESQHAHYFIITTSTYGISEPSEEVTAMNIGLPKEGEINNEDLVQVDAVTEYNILNYPNPFNPTTTIAYQIPKDGFVNLVVYNTLGQVVTELVNEHKESGKYSVQFNASNLPSGVYFYKIESGNFTKVNKMLLLR